VLDWLRHRALLDLTIRGFRLGYVPRAHKVRVEGQDDLWVERGVLIPWCGPDAWHSPVPVAGVEPVPPLRWCGANVRRLPLGDFGGPAPDPKYEAISGSIRGHLYPLPGITPGVPALIVEGEFDGLIAWQEAGWVVNPVSVGGAEQPPRPEALDALTDASHWLVLPDGDAAGVKALAKWEALDGDRVVPVLLPGGAKDLTEFVRAGGDVLGWLAASIGCSAGRSRGHCETALDHERLGEDCEPEATRPRRWSLSCEQVIEQERAGPLPSVRLGLRLHHEAGGRGVGPARVFTVPKKGQNPSFWSPAWKGSAR
jgi:hypothetical protein